MPATSLDFSPDGKLLAVSLGERVTLAQPGEVKLWTLADPAAEPKTLYGHAGRVAQVRISPDGQTIATCGADGDVRLWDAADLDNPRLVLRHERDVTAMLCLDGGKIVTAQKGGRMSLWDTRSGQRQAEFAGHRHEGENNVEVTSLHRSPDRTAIVSAADDDTVRFWPLATRREEQQLRAGGERVQGVAFSRDGKRAFLTRGPGNTLIEWNAESGTELRRLGPHFAPVTAVALSRDDRIAVTGCTDGRVFLWDLRTGGQIRRIDAAHAKEVRSIAVSPDKRYVVTAGLDGYVRVWNTATGEQLRERQGKANPFEIALTPDGRTALVIDDRDAVLWNIETGEETGRLTGHLVQVSSLAVSPNGEQALTGTRRGTLRLWDLKTQELIRRYDGHFDQLRCVAFSPDGRTALSGSEDQTILHWDLETGRILEQLDGHSAAVLDVAFAPDGKSAISGAADQTARLRTLRSTQDGLSTADFVRAWSPVATIAELKSRLTLDAHPGGAWFAAFSPDGKRLASGGEGGAVRLWDPATGAEQTKLDAHKGIVTCGTFSPDGAVLATGGSDKMVKLWNVETGELLATLAGHTEMVRQLDFSPDGTRLASSSEDGTARMWDVASHKPLWSIRENLPVYNVRFSPDGTLVATASGKWQPRENGLVKLWNAEDGSAARTIDESRNVQTALAFSPDGGRIVARNGAGAFVLWNVETGEAARTVARSNGYRDAVFTP
ncbi:MAG: hypothetical protein ACREIV_02990, partial [Planctomycetaceae bacterium]